MKKFEDMTLEETMGKVYANIKRFRIWQIILSILLISIVLNDVFKFETVSNMSIGIPILCIGLLMLQSNSNSAALAKLYEKIMKDEKNK